VASVGWFKRIFLNRSAARRPSPTAAAVSVFKKIAARNRDD
jgi:hypothetical protein